MDNAKISWAGDVPIDKVIPDPRQPRRHFDPAALAQLAASIQTQGIIEPLIVRPIGKPGDPFGAAAVGAKYILVAGERRWRAAKQLKLGTVPVIVRAYEPQQAHLAQLGENMDREGLRPLEIAESYHRWLQPTSNPVTTVIDGKLRSKPQYARTQAELAKALGKTEAHVSQLLALRDLSAPAKRLLDDGTLSLAHARPLLPLIDHPKSLQRIVGLIEERVRWGYVFTSREIASRAHSELTRVKAAERRRQQKAKRKSAGKPSRTDNVWMQERAEAQRREALLRQRWAAGLKATAPRLAKQFTGDPVHDLVRRVPPGLQRLLAPGLRLPSWGDDADIVRALHVGSTPARRIAAWVWLRQRLPGLKLQVFKAGVAVQAQKVKTPARKGGRK